jgi:hypothetical protein
MATTGKTAELEAQLAAVRERDLERAKRLYIHLNTGDVPDDETLLAQLPHLEEQALRVANTPDEDEGSAPIEIPAPLAAVLETMAAAQRENTEAILALAKAQAAAAPAARETALKGDVGELAAALDGTTSDGGDGEDPLEEPVTFMSKGAEMKVIVVPRRRYTGPTGEQYFTNGITLDFGPNGQYTTRNRRNVEILRSRPGMNREYWELGKEPHAKPNPQLVIDAIFAAVLELDDEKLAEIERTEQQGHKREEVLRAVRSARERVQGFTPPEED